ncbi:cactin, spliceosome C complex subunit [Anticarsia gemmatalis]|uniref:cactin, spliceosome C complex subunit n=1 Tax=Anticarsia gemmatalis TaxID=129554 RepID=UPI003F77655E
MSSRHEVQRRGRSRSRSVERRKDRKHKSRERVRSHSRKKSKSKHRSSSRERHSSKHKKSKKKKRHSSSSSSSSDSDDELKLLQRLEAERARLKEEKKKQKEQMKANETPEEKRARRLKEKQEKERKRRERMGWDNEYQCYTNQDNPFGDSALTNTFVWGKKLAKEGVKNVSRDELEALNRQKQLENKIELEKVKQRRLEREAERAAREADAAAAARAREALQFHTWAKHEDAFHLHQARLRSQIRIRDGRAKPIDLLAWYVSSEECVDALEMHEPYTYLNGLQTQDLEDLLEDIKVYKELENNANVSYWEDVQTIVLDELNKLRRVAAPDARRDGVHQAVADDVTLIFKGKTGAQLEALQTQIEQKISGRRDGVDVGYWESLLSQLKAHMSRARLRDRHQNNLRRKLQLLKQEQGVQPVSGADVKEEPGQSQSPAEESAPEPSSSAQAEASELAEQAERAERAEKAEVSDSAESGAEHSACTELYASGRYSPVLLVPTALEPGTLLTEPADDTQRLAYLRARLHAQRDLANSQQAATSAAAAPGGSLERVARRAMGSSADEVQFSVEHALPDQPCLWADKYRPRKPRYFNRVHTGFEWNKYNQTHYDMDNPPPKIVQGYKFNIFYPDLIDKNATPEFSLKPCPENPDFAVLRFHAGPPYEDIAFKIVNREWEYSYKRGFRCHFHNNIFQLWFHFKRYRYRR